VRGGGAGRTLFLDAFSGVAGDMLCAALLDLGVPMEPIAAALDALPLRGYQTSVEHAARSGIGAQRFIVTVDAGQPERTYREIRSMLEGARGLADGARSIALDAFHLLAHAEARVHRATLEDVHFHEVGAVDSIVDIVACAVALDYLGAEVVCSPLPMGHGTVVARHGALPLPAPATVECLRGAPTYDAGIDGELVTPTGACLVMTVAHAFARWPSIRPARIGWGAGTRELSDRPNLLRVVLGDMDPEGAHAGDHALVSSYAVLEANVDDMSAEIAAFAMERAFEAGALDAWTSPIVMKKGRPAMMLCALVRRADIDAVARALLTETTSLGLRVRPIERIERPRRIVHVETRFGSIPIKVATGDGLPEQAAPEHDACREAARTHGVPLKDVYAVALAAYRLVAER